MVYRSVPLPCPLARVAGPRFRHPDVRGRAVSSSTRAVWHSLVSLLLEMWVWSRANRLKLSPIPNICGRSTTDNTLRICQLAWIGDQESTVTSVLESAGGLHRLLRQTPGDCVDDGDGLTRATAPPLRHRECPGEVRAVCRSGAKTGSKRPAVRSARQPHRRWRAMPLESRREVFEARLTTDSAQVSRESGSFGRLKVSWSSPPQEGGGRFGLRTEHTHGEAEHQHAAPRFHPIPPS
jgi:hypothetical protein